MIGSLIDAAMRAVFGRRCPPRTYVRKVGSAYESLGRGEYAGQKLVEAVKDHSSTCDRRPTRCYQLVLPKENPNRAFRGDDVWTVGGEFHEMDLHTGDIFAQVLDQRVRR